MLLSRWFIVAMLFIAGGLMVATCLAAYHAWPDKIVFVHGGLLAVQLSFFVWDVFLLVRS